MRASSKSTPYLSLRANLRKSLACFTLRHFISLRVLFGQLQVLCWVPQKHSPFHCLSQGGAQNSHRVMDRARGQPLDNHRVYDLMGIERFYRRQLFLSECRPDMMLEETRVVFHGTL